MLSTLRLAHCADVHLDSDYYGGARGAAQAQRAREAFAALLADMAAQHPDVLLIAGDLFDHNRASAQTIEFAAQALADVPFAVVLLPGNHDCLEPGGVLRHPAWAQAGVHRMLAEQGAALHLAGLDLALWGRGMREHTPQFRPLAGAPRRPADDAWHVGLAHGLVREEPDALHSSLIHVHEIGACEFDYLALGHVHVAREVGAGAVPAWYPGAALPSVRDAGSWLCVDLAPGAPAQVRVARIAAP
jgi:DNA repair protein SbcD/Mre11